jgi:hypothetical protein
MNTPVRERIRKEAAEYLAVCDSLDRCSFDQHRVILDGHTCASCGLHLGDYIAMVPLTWPDHRC